MEHDNESPKRRLIRRRLPLRRPADETIDEPRPAKRFEREIFYYQVYFQPRPGARRNHLDAVQRKLTERLHVMVHRGQLLLSARFAKSLGGLWLLRVKSQAEAERLVLEHPAVACNLLTFRLVELEDPAGIVVKQEREIAAEAVTETEAEPATVPENGAS